MGQRKSGSLKIKRLFKSPKACSACSLQSEEAHLGHCVPNARRVHNKGWRQSLLGGVVFGKNPSYQLQSTGLQLANE